MKTEASSLPPDSHGRLVPTVGGMAFVPLPLPPRFAWSDPVVQQLSRAERMIGRLQGVLRDVDNPKMLIRPLQTREAVMSSQIEGTQATLQDMYRDRAGAEAGPDDPRRDTERLKAWVRETRNAETALRQAMKLKDELPIAKQLWLRLHAVLMDGVRGGQADPGAFRRIQNWIGQPGCTLRGATYVPPPPQMVLDCLDDLERFIHGRSELPPLVRLAMIHYQFEAIHPFIDGNGRLGRLLNTLLMAEWNILTAPPIDLSSYFKREQATYYRLLLAVSREGAWNAWIAFFLRGLADQAEDVYERATRLLALRQKYRRLLREHPTPRNANRLIDRLFITPWFTVGEAAKRMGVAFNTAQRTVNRFEQLGLVREVTGRQRDRVYAAEEVFAVINDPIPHYDETTAAGPSLFTT